MEIGCPSCRETYSIAAARLPASRVRTACLTCGEILFLRRGASLDRPAGAQELERELASREDVRPWSEPPHRAPEPAPQRAPAGFSFDRVGDVSARAQRLARALVSDILVYHPRKVEQGLREGNLKELMRDEVEKSWDEYSERLGADLARANRGHFVRALNEILGRGASVF